MGLITAFRLSWVLFAAIFATQGLSGGGYCPNNAAYNVTQTQQYQYNGANNNFAQSAPGASHNAPSFSYQGGNSSPSSAPHVSSTPPNNHHYNHNYTSPTNHNSYPTYSAVPPVGTQSAIMGQTYGYYYSTYLNKLNPQPQLSSYFRTHRSTEFKTSLNAFNLVRQSIPNILQEEIAAIRYYTGGAYSSLNAALRSMDFKAVSDIGDVLFLATSGLRKMNKYVGTVYRGTKISGETFSQVMASYRDSMNAGTYVQEKGFTSSAIEMGKAWSGNIQYVIQSKFGVYVDDISKVKGEKEVLFAPGSWFRVTNMVDMGGGNWTIYMDEVTDLAENLYPALAS